MLKKIFGIEERNRLKVENQRLQEDLTAIRESSTYGLAQDLEQAIEDASREDGPDFADREAEAIAKLREERIQSRTNTLIKALAEQAVAGEKAAIEQEAAQRAAAEAQKIRQQFLDEEAGPYRERVTEQTSQWAGRLGVAGAKVAVIQEVLSGMELPNEDDPETAERIKNENKVRARKLWAEAHDSGMLKLSRLQCGDSITLGFTTKGSGDLPLTESGGYYGDSRYRSELEARRLTFRVLDPEAGIMEATSDSWMHDQKHKHKDDVIRGGRHGVLSATNPNTGEPDSVLVKNQPVEFRPTEGNAIPQQELALWWVNLGEYRALS